MRGASQKPWLFPQLRLDYENGVQGAVIDEFANSYSGGGAHAGALHSAAKRTGQVSRICWRGKDLDCRLHGLLGHYIKQDGPPTGLRPSFVAA